MDWLSPLSGLVGALLGAGASYFGSRQVLNQQLEDNRQAREEAERTVVVAALSKALSALLEHAALIPEDPAHRQGGLDHEEYERLGAAEDSWDQGWQPLVTAARVAALEVRHADLRKRLTLGLRYLEDWSTLEYAFHGKVRAWILRGVVDYLVESLYAWRRSEELPTASRRFTDVAEAWDLKQEEYEMIAQLQAEEQAQLRAEKRARRELSGDKGTPGNV